MAHKNALVIGAGAFGTSMASVLAKNFKNVILKVRSQDVYDSLNAKENKIYLPGQSLPDNLSAALSWDEVNSKIGNDLDIIIFGLPTGAIQDYCEQNYKELKRYLNLGIPFVSLSKGIDSNTLELPDELFSHRFHNYQEQLCYLSGPSFAKEILQEQITLVSVAGKSPKILKAVSEMLDTDYFKVFGTYDIKGVLLGGALKNVIAIAGGIVEGYGFNHNTRAALITRAIREMLRFGVVYGAREETFYGLSGMGDLILTTTGGLSRNKQFGMEIAKGRSPDEIIASQRSVVEGHKTAKSVHLIAQKFEIRCLIFQGVYQVLYEGLDPKKALEDLMRSTPSFES